MQPEFLSKKSVAEFFDTSISTVGRWVESGVLPPPATIGGLERWPVSVLIKAACNSMDKSARNTTPSQDADEATERAIHAARENSKAASRRRYG